MRQGKGASDATPGTTPVATPKSSRKRPATSAPSTGRSTATKKARSKAAKAPERTVIKVDDDDSEHSPIQTPTKSRRVTINLDPERASYAQHGTDYDTCAPLGTAASSSDLTLSESPDNDEDVKPTTPGEAPSYSFAQASQPSAGGDAWNMWGNSSFGAGNAHHFSDDSGPRKGYVGDEYDDELSV